MPRPKKNNQNDLSPVVKNRHSSYSDLTTVVNRENIYKEYSPLSREYQSDYSDFHGDTTKNITRAMWAYKKIGVIRNSVDLLGDFACDGISFTNKNKKDQGFLQEWAKKVDVVGVSQRFCNMLFRCSNVLVQRTHARISAPEKKSMKQAVGKVYKNRIPWSYTINSPLNLSVLGGIETSLYLGKVNYGIKIPEEIKVLVKNREKSSLEDAELLNLIPQTVVEAVNSGKNVVPLDPDTTRIFHYKKDDWEIWSEPIISSFYDDVIMLSKLKMCDMSILDGATQRRTLWKIGDLTHKIIPNQPMLESFADMLKTKTDNGEQDIVYGPAIDFKESSSEFYKYLGSEKYGNTYRSIYEGLGIPYIINGEGNSAGSLSLRVMIQRLKYVRNILVQFWTQEIKEIEKAMGLTPGTRVTFAHINLNDPVAELSLYIQLADRNLISIETIQQRFGEIPEVEEFRQRREQKEINAGKRPRKASQWHNPEHKETLEKIALTSGVATPSQVGLDLPAKKDGEISLLELKNTQEAKQPGESGKGRPLNSKDKEPRTRSTKAFADFISEKKRFVDLSKSFTAGFLDFVKKKDLRSLNDEEFSFMEERKFAAFCSQNGRTFEETFSDPDIHIPVPVLKKYNEICSDDMNVDQKRDCMVYAFIKGDENGFG